MIKSLFFIYVEVLIGCIFEKLDKKITSLKFPLSKIQVSFPILINPVLSALTFINAFLIVSVLFKIVLSK